MIFVFYILMYWHFLVMVMLVLLFSGLIRFLFPRLHSFTIILASGLIGLLYSLMFEANHLAIFAMMINVIFSCIAIGLVKYNFYLIKKAEELEKSD